MADCSPGRSLRNCRANFVRPPPGRFEQQQRSNVVPNPINGPTMGWHRVTQPHQRSDDGAPEAVAAPNRVWCRRPTGTRGRFAEACHLPSPRPMAGFRPGLCWPSDVPPLGLEHPPCATAGVLIPALTPAMCHRWGSSLAGRPAPRDGLSGGEIGAQFVHESLDLGKAAGDPPGRGRAATARRPAARATASCRRLGRSRSGGRTRGPGGCAWP